MRTTRNSTGSPLHGQSTPQATGAMYTNRAWLTHFHALTGDLEELAGAVSYTHLTLPTKA